jgi:hypothetical protein
MYIQLNTDKNISGNVELEIYLNSTIDKELSHYSDHITRVEVNLADENSSKKGENDIRCNLEARIENYQPIAVTGYSDTVEKSVSEAIKKLKAVIDTTLGKKQGY